MTGIQYVTNEKGEQVAVQIDLKQHGEMWEDFHDLLVCAQREHEEDVPLDKVLEDLDKNGKL
ncbi:MAG: hypothetical protein ACPGRX_01145 [Bdellovibrionales bacterium]